MQNRILIVDDDELVLVCFERLLARQFTIETALGPYAALHAIQSRGPFAVVLSDLRMPGMNGIQLIEKARQIQPNTVGVLLSGNAESTTPPCDSVFRVLEKPCPTPTLAATLTDALNEHLKRCGEGSTGKI